MRITQIKSRVWGTCFVMFDKLSIVLILLQPYGVTLSRNRLKSLGASEQKHLDPCRISPNGKHSYRWEGANLFWSDSGNVLYFLGANAKFPKHVSSHGPPQAATSEHPSKHHLLVNFGGLANATITQHLWMPCIRDANAMSSQTIQRP